MTDGLTGSGEHVLGWNPDVIDVAAEEGEAERAIAAIGAVQRDEEGETEICIGRFVRRVRGVVRLVVDLPGSCFCHPV